MTKDIQRLKKQLLMEELHRQGKAPKKGLWLLIGLGLMVLVAAGVLWYQANLQDILEDRYQGALQLKEQGEYTAAVDKLQTLYEDHPQFVRASDVLYQVAEIQQLYLGRHSDALLTYLMLVRDFPDGETTLSAQQQIAAIYKFRLNDCGQAIAAYQKVLDGDVANGDRVQYDVADCYFRLNNFAQARIEFESLLKNYPESGLEAEVQYRIAVTYALEAKLSEAVGAFRLVIEQWPDGPYGTEARFGLAKALEEQEELRESLSVLEELVGVYPNTEVLMQKIEQVKARIDKKKKAI